MRRGTQLRRLTRSLAEGNWGGGGGETVAGFKVLKLVWVQAFDVLVASSSGLHREAEAWNFGCCDNLSENVPSTSAPCGRDSRKLQRQQQKGSRNLNAWMNSLPYFRQKSCAGTGVALPIPGQRTARPQRSMNLGTK